MTLKELGDRVGRTASSLSLVENGKREPGYSLVEALAQAFGVGVALAELFGASSLGVAFGVGQITFALCCVALLARA